MVTETQQPLEGCHPRLQRTNLEPSDGAKKTILIVEADVTFLQGIVYILRWAGYEILVAHTSTEALCLCLRTAVTIDLIMSDFNLPGGNGAELAAMVSDLRPDLPIIFMTGNRTAVQTLRMQGWVVLAKPFSFAEMTSVVHKVLSGLRHIKIFPKAFVKASMQ